MLPRGPALREMLTVLRYTRPGWIWQDEAKRHSAADRLFKAGPGVLTRQVLVL